MSNNITYRPRACVICGKMFNPCNSVQKTCNAECAAEHHRRWDRAYSKRKYARRKAREANKAKAAKMVEHPISDEALKRGVSYAEIQKERTLAMVPKIEVKL